MREAFCGAVRSHAHHEWVTTLWLGHITIGRHTVRLRLRGPKRMCPGAITARCGRDATHPAHWHGEMLDELCPGSGLAGYCKHGEQLLNACLDCETGL
jgi:hypothetical protein